jgi:hypothetical protein
MTKKKKKSEQYIRREKVAALLKAGVDKPSIAGQGKLSLRRFIILLRDWRRGGN